MLAGPRAPQKKGDLAHSTDAFSLLRRADASSIHTCCELIQRMRDKTAEDNAPKLEAAAKRHKQTIDTKTPQEKQHEAKQNEAGKSFAGNGQFHSC